MKTRASATAMSKAWLQEQGYIVGLTEQNVRIPKKQPNGEMRWEMFKRDLWTFADLTAIHPEKQGTLYVQCTIGMNNKPERMQKILAADATPVILKAGNQVSLHVWRKLKGSGRVKWELAVYSLLKLGTEKPAWYDHQNGGFCADLDVDLFTGAQVSAASTSGQVEEDF